MMEYEICERCNWWDLKEGMCYEPGEEDKEPDESTPEKTYCTYFKDKLDNKLNKVIKLLKEE